MPEIDHGFTTEMKYGIIGSFTNKYSLDCLKVLTQNWYNVSKVYPISRKHEELFGLKTYYSLKDLPEPIDVLVMVHKKEITFEILKEVLTLSYKPAIWFMPSTSSPENIAFCEENGLKYANSCLLGHREFKGISKVFNMHFIHSKISGMHRIPKQDALNKNDEELLVEN